jgi:hypothetical protein
MRSVALLLLAVTAGAPATPDGPPASPAPQAELRAPAPAAARVRTPRPQPSRPGRRQPAFGLRR